MYKLSSFKNFNALLFKRSESKKNTIISFMVVDTDRHGRVNLRFVNIMIDDVKWHKKVKIKINYSMYYTHN